MCIRDRYNRILKTSKCSAGTDKGTVPNKWQVDLKLTAVHLKYQSYNKHKVLVMSLNCRCRSANL